MPRAFEVTMSDERVVLYLYDHMDAKKFTRADLYPDEARRLARELGLHADDVEDMQLDAQEQMA